MKTKRLFWWMFGFLIVELLFFELSSVQITPSELIQISPRAVAASKPMYFEPNPTILGASRLMRVLQDDYHALHVDERSAGAALAQDDEPLFFLKPVARSFVFTPEALLRRRFLSRLVNSFNTLILRNKIPPTLMISNHLRFVESSYSNSEPMILHFLVQLMAKVQGVAQSRIFLESLSAPSDVTCSLCFSYELDHECCKVDLPDCLKAILKGYGVGFLEYAQMRLERRYSEGQTDCFDCHVPLDGQPKPLGLLKK